MDSRCLKAGMAALASALLVLSSGCSAASSVEEAAQSTKVWKSLATPFTEGVYESGDHVFVVVSQPAGGSSMENRTWASRQTGLSLFKYVLGKVQDLNEVERMLLSESKNSSLKVPGHVLFSGVKEGNYVSVFSTTRPQVLDTRQNRQWIRREAVAIATEALKKPSQYRKILSSYGLNELVLLDDVKSRRDMAANVVVPTAAPSLSAAGASVQTNPESELNRLMSGNPQTLRDELRQKHIAVVDIRYSLPVLKQVADRQGFVKFDTGFSDGTPVALQQAEDLFKRRGDLAVIESLLELAAEIAPRNPRIWELLEASYRASGQMDKAHLANRIWFTMTRDSNQECVFRLMRYGTDPAGSEFRRYVMKSVRF